MKRCIIGLLAAILVMMPITCRGEAPSRNTIIACRKAAEQGSAIAQFNLGHAYDFGQGVPQDYTKSVRWYRKAAEQGNAAAQASIGYAYGFGHGVKQDYAEAARWYFKAAEQGSATAQFNLGMLYHNGQGVRQDKRIAKEWFGKACDNGMEKGCDAYRKLNEVEIQ